MFIFVAFIYDHPVLLGTYVQIRMFTVGCLFIVYC